MPQSSIFAKDPNCRSQPTLCSNSKEEKVTERQNRNSYVGEHVSWTYQTPSGDAHVEGARTTAGAVLCGDGQLRHEVEALRPTGETARVSRVDEGQPLIEPLSVRSLVEMSTLAGTKVARRWLARLHSATKLAMEMARLIKDYEKEKE